MSIGRGASAAISNQIQSVGTNLLFVRPGSSSSSGVRGAEGSAATLTAEDGEALQGIPGVVAIAPEVDEFGQIVYQGNNINPRILGVTPEYLDASTATVDQGDFISAGNVTAKSLTACLGSTIASTLFQGDDPIGKTVRINNVPFKVGCTMAAKGGTGFLSQDSQVFLPLTSAQTRLGRGGRFHGGNNVDVLNIKLTDTSQTDAVTQQISDVLRQRHHIIGDDDFTVTSQQDLLSAATSVTNTLTIFLGGIAAISLIVGGIGIMNIMLVERHGTHREIGIRKAVGAERHDILMQFLTEATVLSVLGGLIGTALGWGIAVSLGHVSLGNQQISPVVDTTAIVLAVAFSVAVGLFFGIYPALHTSRRCAP